MMTERGVAVDHSTIYRWVQRFAPEMEKRLRWQWRRPRSRSWRIDETYVRVRGQWAYLYRALDKFGNTHRFLPLIDPQHQGREAIPRQGSERIEGLGAARGAEHRQGADLRRRHRRAESRGQMPERDEAQTGEGLCCKPDEGARWSGRVTCSP